MLWGWRFGGLLLRELGEKVETRGWRGGKSVFWGGHQGSGEIVWGLCEVEEARISGERTAIVGSFELDLSLSLRLGQARCR